MTGNVMRGREIAEVFPRTEVIEQEWHLRSVARRVGAAYDPARREQHSGQHANQRRLPAAVFTGNPEHLAGEEIEIDPVEDSPLPEPQSQPPGHEDRFRPHHRPTCFQWKPPLTKKLKDKWRKIAKILRSIRTCRKRVIAMPFVCN